MSALLLDGYWPFWLGGPALGSLVVVMWIVERRSLGVSGSIAAVLRKDSDEDKAFRAAAENDEDAIADAMLRATLEEFGEEAVAAFMAEMAEDEDAPSTEKPRSRSPLAFGVHFSFLLMLIAGGALGSLVSGGWSFHATLGAVHESLTGGGLWSLGALVIGGIFVGFGTRMSGGCTSGHGLSGCSRFEPASLLATASFFGAAVAVSFLLRALAA